LTSVCPGVGGVYYVVKDSKAASFSWKVENGTILENRKDTLIVKWDDTADVDGSVSVTSHYLDEPSITKVLVVRIEKGLFAPLPVGDTLVIQGCSKKVHTYEVPFAPDYFYAWNVLNGIWYPEGNIYYGKGANKASFTFDEVGRASIMVVISYSGSERCSVKEESGIDVNVLTKSKIYGDTIVCSAFAIGNYKYNNLESLDYTWQVQNGSVIYFHQPDSVEVKWDIDKFPNGPFTVGVSHLDKNCVSQNSFLKVALLKDCRGLNVDYSHELDKMISLFPNPSNGEFKILISQPVEFNLKAINNLGKEEIIFYNKMTGEATLANPIPGIYNILIQTRNRNTSKRLVVSE
jgi:hypothetical protein